LADFISTDHYRSRSNPSDAALGVYGGYAPPSASKSPAQLSIGLQSPVTQHAYSPRSSSPPSAPVYGNSYDIPHHARATQSAAELRLRDYSAAQSKRHWQRSPLDDVSMQTPMASDFLTRRTARAPESLPPLVHQDTTQSSHGDSLPTPMPYQAHILPPLDPAKADRMLPTPIPSMTNSAMVHSPLDMRHQHQFPTSHISARPALNMQGSQFDALLRASELARDADLQDEASRQGESSR
jgi:hypothetical protein